MFFHFRGTSGYGLNLFTFPHWQWAKRDSLWLRVIDKVIPDSNGSWKGC